MPDIYWITQLMFIRTKMHQEWKYFWEPQGELIGSIAEPSVFQEYSKNKKKLSQGESVEDAMKNPTGDGLTGASTDLHYDPIRGLIDANGTLVIPKEEFEKDANIGGLAISY